MRWFLNRRVKIENCKLPVHIGIIMDGNGRWAKKRRMPRQAGHTVGAKTFRKITSYCSKIGIKYLTVYAFSTENLNRPKDEVSSLMALFKSYLNEALTDFVNENIKVIFLGNKSVFSEELRDLIEKVEKESSEKTGLVLNIAMNYGGRDEIVMAAKSIAKSVKDGSLSVDDITKDVIADNLYTKGEPDPDLIIRTGGEHRISNFLLWQSAYAEYVILDVLWPDFCEADIDKAISQYNLRNRRYGGV